MNKIFISLFLFILLFLTCPIKAVEVYSSDDNKFGLKEDDKIITEAIYSKLIRLGNTSYIFSYKNKYGIIDKTGKILVEPKYSSCQRYVGRYVKFGSMGRYGVFDESGNAVVPFEYSSIDLLYGRMFLVKKNYKYGLISFEGDIILAPVADDIYMPKANVLKISYDGTWYEIEHTSKDTMELPTDILLGDIKSRDFKITTLVEQPITSTGYGIVSASDYFIKLFSSISPAYEQTIDELIFSHGADTATILIKPMWLLKFPFVYSKNYYNNVKTPNNGPLADVKANLKNKLN